MTRLPIPGGDSGNWGDILNTFLSQVHASDGTLKTDSVTSDAIAPNAVTSSALAPNAVDAITIADGSITETLLDTAVQAKLNATAPVTSVASKTGDVSLTKTDVGLDQVDNTSDATKNSATATLTNKTLNYPIINMTPDDGSGWSYLENFSPFSGSNAQFGYASNIDSDVGFSIIADRGLTAGFGKTIQLKVMPFVSTDVRNLTLWPSNGGSVAIYSPSGQPARIMTRNGSTDLHLNDVPIVTTTGTQTLTNKTLTAPIISPGGVPATASSTGTAGAVAWDSSYFYVCVATDTWVRSPLTSW